MPNSVTRKISHTSNTYVHHLFSLYLESLNNLPCYVYCKNFEGIYLGYNDYGADHLGYNDGSKLYGKTDYDIFPPSVADTYRLNDNLVTNKEQQIFFPENGIIKDNIPVIFLSHKMPLYNEENTVCGILGLSFVNTSLENPIEKNILPITETLSQSNIFLLSEKEKTCLSYLCQGLTYKMIAKRMNISNKTVETYIERAKAKLNCHNKAELILAFIKNKRSMRVS